MAYRQLSSSLLIASLASLPGCFNPEPGTLDTETETDTGGTADGGPATMTSMTMTTDPTGDGTVDDGTDTMPATDDATDVNDDPPECTEDADCADMAGECETATCDGGACMIGNVAAGEPCGDASATDCDLADTCDGNGACAANLVADGIDCLTCDSGQCSCTAGACDDCIAFADTNLFTTARSINGWDLTGDWGLYTEAPFSPSGPAIPFGNQVLGTDGNRHAPYPGGHAERSYARTPPVQLPNSLEFQSWHLDEGSGSYDNKIIRISTDGGTSWTDIISCPLNPMLPFCTYVDTRAADDWDAISLDLPAPLIGQVGIIEFAYDTYDSCCNFEKGWFIDVTNFATECLCTSNSQCTQYGGECGDGECGSNGGCTLDAQPVGLACGEDADDACTTPDTCDGDGYCQRNDNLTAGPPIGCGSCEAGSDCNGCEAGVCVDCLESNTVNDFQFPSGFGSPVIPSDAGFVYNTVAGGGWGIRFSISNNEQDEGALSPTYAPFIGIDGNAAPPFDGVGETAIADFITRPDVFADTLTFDSWHQDEGGQTFDRKRIEVTVDEGMTWTTVADCAGGGTLDDFDFCLFRDNRQAEDWDAIEIDTSAWADMLGQVRVTYDTVNAASGFERGWYLDNINFAQNCLTPNYSSQGVACVNLTEEHCIDHSYCAWDSGASACFECTSLGDETACDAEPLCEWRTTAGGGGGLCFGIPQ